MSDDEKDTTKPTEETKKDSKVAGKPDGAADGTTTSTAAAGTSKEGDVPSLPALPMGNPMMMGQMSGQFNPNMMGFPVDMMRKRLLDQAGDDFAPTIAAKKAKAEEDTAVLKQAAAGGDDAKYASATPIPASKEGIKFYSRNDVLCGRGGGTNVHPGNRRFRDLINANRRAYLKARKNDKPAISRSIVRTIREMNGRFLRKDEKQGLWFEIGDDGAREKTSQALRQRAPEMRKILFEDEQRQQVAQQEVMMQRQFMMQGGMNPMMMNNMQMGGMGMNPMMMMNGMGGMGMGMGMGGAGMGMSMNAENFAAMQGAKSNVAAAGSGAGGGGGGAGGANGDNSPMSMMTQKNLLAQEKAMLMQRLQGINNLQNSTENMTAQSLVSQGAKAPSPKK